MASLPTSKNRRDEYMSIDYSDPSAVKAWLDVLKTGFAILTSLGAIFYGIPKFCFWIWDEVQKRRNPELRGVVIPKKSLRVFVSPKEYECHWGLGKKGADPIMSVQLRGKITNITKNRIRIIHIELRHGFMGRKKVPVTFFATDHPESRFHSSEHPLEPGYPHGFTAMFFVFPPPLSAPVPFEPHSLVFYDQFNNRHVVKNVKINALPNMGQPS